MMIEVVGSREGERERESFSLTSNLQTSSLYSKVTVLTACVHLSDSVLSFLKTETILCPPVFSNRLCKEYVLITAE